MHKVSVIIPVYNTQKYLRECIGSAINQTFIDIEIILIDDGSTDKSGEICDEFAKHDKRIKVFHTSNFGPSLARNIGINNASGEYLVFLDSDDYIDAEMVEDMINEAQKNNPDLVICGYKKFYEYNKNITKVHFLKKKRYYKRKDYLSDFYKYFPLIFNPVWGKLYKSKIVIENNLKFIDGLSLGEDLVFNSIYYNKIDKVSILNNVHYYYRQYKDTLCRRYRENIFDILFIYFSEIKTLLINNKAYSPINRQLVMGNCFSRCFEEICHFISFNKKLSLLKKINRVNEYMNKEIVIESGKYYKPKDLREVFLPIIVKIKMPFTLVIAITFKDFLKKILPQIERYVLWE
jgi:glycosyltransferase involved in cell wall biosynthesis